MIMPLWNYESMELLCSKQHGLSKFHFRHKNFLVDIFMESVEKQENQSQALSGSSAVNFPEGNRDSGELKSAFCF